MVRMVTAIVTLHHKHLLTSQTHVRHCHVQFDGMLEVLRIIWMQLKLICFNRLKLARNCKLMPTSTSRVYTRFQEWYSNASEAVAHDIGQSSNLEKVKLKYTSKFLGILLQLRKLMSIVDKRLIPSGSVTSILLNNYLLCTWMIAVNNSAIILLIERTVKSGNTNLETGKNGHNGLYVYEANSVLGLCSC